MGAERPVPQAARSKAAAGRESVGMVQLRRLHRRVLQLGRCPFNQRLRDKIAKQLEALRGRFPWLDEIRFFEMEHFGDFLEGKILEVEGEVACVSLLRSFALG